jgi:hypothetical protein
MDTLAELRAALSSFLGSGSSRARGEALEVFFGELLAELGARNLQRCRPGLQFGRDFMFNREGRRFYAECKNLGRDVAPRDLAEKLVWFPLLNPGDYYAIVSPTPLGNTLQQYLLANQHVTTFLDWSGDNFLRICSQAPETLLKLCGHAVGVLIDRDLRAARDLVECRDGAYPPVGLLTSHIVHQLGTPFTWVFYLSEEGVERAIPAGDATFRVHLFNRTPDAVTIDNLGCEVERVSDLPARLIAWGKLKGIVEPPKFTVDVSNGKRDFPDLLAGRVLKVGAHDHEVFDLDVVGDIPHGVYSVRLLARCVGRAGSSTLTMDPFTVVALWGDPPAPQVLGVFGRGRNEGTARELLMSSTESWERYLRAGTSSPASRYLGPTPGQENWMLKGDGLEEVLGPIPPELLGQPTRFNGR